MPVELGSAYGKIEIGTEGAESNIKNLQSTLDSTGKNLTLGVTAPLVAAGALALKSAGDFEQSLNIMAQVSGATAAEMELVQAQALEMGAVTSFSAGEAAEAQLELAKAGMSVQETMTALPGVMELAAAGGVSLANAANLTSSAINAFGLSVEQSSEVANMFAAAANASSADISDLGQGFTQAGFAFNAAGQGADDLAAALALLTNVGMGGSDAGTALKNAMMRLINPTKEAAELMDQLGIEAYDTNGVMLPLADIIQEFATATEGMSDQQRNAALSTILMGDGMKAMTPLLDAGKQGFLEMKDAVTAEGSAADTANARMAGFAGSIEYIKGSIDSFLITAALPFLDSISGIIRVVADAITSIGALDEPTRNMAIAFAAAAAAVGPLMLGLSGLMSVMGLLLSPIGLIAAAIAALAVAWYTDFGGIQTFTATAIAEIVPAFQNLVTSINTVLGPLQQIGLAMLDAGVNSTEASEAITLLPASIQPVATAFQNLVTTLQTIGNQLAVFFAPALERLSEAFAGLPESLAPLLPSLQQLGMAFLALGTAIQPLIMLLGGALAVAADLGINALAAVISNLPGIVEPIINQVTASINLIATTITSMVGIVKAVIDGDWAAAWVSAQALFQGFYDYFNNTVGALNAIAKAIFTIIADTITGTLEDLGIDIVPILDGIKATFESIWAKITAAMEPIISMITAIQTKLTEFKNFLGGLSLPNPFAALQEAGAAVQNMLGQATGGVLGTPGKAIGTSYFPGGVTAMNERGQEAVVLPAGARILTNGQTNNMNPQPPPVRNITINIPSLTIAGEMDMKRFRWQLANELAGL